MNPMIADWIGRHALVLSNLALLTAFVVILIGVAVTGGSDRIQRRRHRTTGPGFPDPGAPTGNCLGPDVGSTPR